MAQLFALTDCNNFYASCERVFNPKLEGKPVVVLSNNDGCVIARSNEAKLLGIKMGEPAFQMKELLERHKVSIFSSNYALYGDMSERVMNILAQFTPNLEVYSIDEAFLDFSNLCVPDLVTYTKCMQETVKQWTGIPVSVGVGPTKTLAKIANRLSKKSDKAKGALVLTEPRHIEAALKRTEVGDIWGIGRQYARFLMRHGIFSAWDFRNASSGWIKKNMHIVGLRTQEELKGYPCIEMELEPPAKKGICTSRSFGMPVFKLEHLKEAIAAHASRCAEKLRKQRSCANVLTVFIHTSRFKGGPQYYNSHSLTLPVATSSTLELIHYAHLALQIIYRDGPEYKKSGVILTEIVPDKQIQYNFLDTVDREKHLTLMATMDRLNQRFGSNTIKSAALGSGKRIKMRQERLSPCYTTRFKDMLTVRI